MSKEQFLEAIFKQIRDQYPEWKNQRAFSDALKGRIEQYRADKLREAHEQIKSLLDDGEYMEIVKPEAV